MAQTLTLVSCTGLLHKKIKYRNKLHKYVQKALCFQRGKVGAKMNHSTAIYRKRLLLKG